MAGEESRKVNASYFLKLKTDTPTRVWVNNPTLEEVDLALAQGAVGSTTNPAYGGNLLRRAPELVWPAIRSAVEATEDDARAAESIQLALVGRIVDRFRPLYDETRGSAGFVSCQGAPEEDTDADHILAEARAARTLGPNATPKIPATLPGLKAFEAIIAEGSPTIITEVFSLAQVVEANERYLAVTARTGVRPPFFMSPITGIFADHLRAVAARQSISVDATAMGMVGVILTRACYELCVDREYPVTLLAGGARIPFDLTGLAGAAVHATINWSTIAEILAQDPPPTASFADPIDPGIVRLLEDAFPEVRAALRIDGLDPAEFVAFGPVRFFRDIFIAGWRQVQAAIVEARTVPETLR
jgi:transaldolase